MSEVAGPFALSAAQIRVLGCLLEKQETCFAGIGSNKPVSGVAGRLARSVSV